MAVVCFIMQTLYNASMRLTSDQVTIIKQTVAKYIAPSALEGIRLFGSRVDDAKRGGDVDLMLAVREGIERPAYLRALLASQIEKQFELQLGGSLKVDVLLQAPNLNKLPIHQVAMHEGVLL